MHRHLLFGVQFSDYLVIFRVVLETAPGINGAGQPQTVQLINWRVEFTCSSSGSFGPFASVA
jgi:hypothetical protein